MRDKTNAWIGSDYSVLAETLQPALRTEICNFEPDGTFLTVMELRVFMRSFKQNPLTS